MICGARWPDRFHDAVCALTDGHDGPHKDAPGGNWRASWREMTNTSETCPICAAWKATTENVCRDCAPRDDRTEAT